MNLAFRLLRLLPLLAALCLGGFRCDRPPAAPSSERTPTPLGAPDLSLLVLTDPKGYLEPCGCQQRPLGGVDKLAAVVREVREEGRPTVLLAAGTLFFGAELHGADRQGAYTQELWKAQTLTDVWSELDMAAVAPGPLDYAHGLEVVAQLREQAEFPWLSANLKGGTDADLVPSVILKRGGHRIGIIGTHSDDPGHPWPAPLGTGDVDGLKKPIAALRAQGANLVIALHSGDRRSARRVAKAGADLVVAGGLDEQEARPPVRQGDSWLLHAGRQGQGVLRVDLALKGRDALVDVSDWSLSTEKARLESEARDLAARIEEWEQDPSVNPDDLATQKQRLARLRTEAASLQRPDHHGRWLSAQWVELDPDTPSNAKVAAQVDAYDRRVNLHNKKALADRTPPKPAPGEPHYVGSEACGSCHADALAWWKTTPHGNAYATLEEVHKQFNLSCVGCHVTGYNQPGGSTVTHVEKLRNVGCETCHGPGSQHVAKPAQEDAIALDVPERVCTGCHNAEHSARFQYDGFKAMLIAPGHGMAMPDEPKP